MENGTQVLDGGVTVETDAVKMTITLDTIIDDFEAWLSDTYDKSYYKSEGFDRKDVMALLRMYQGDVVTSDDGINNLVVNSNTNYNDLIEQDEATRARMADATKSGAYHAANRLAFD
ncbi:MAG: hypothetical protein Pg6A_19490 [Termitinemataceae bacterium]|nr:MAG: hypothetical protein Pg6A_19490 [Termitinemataceae bacterium]